MSVRGQDLVFRAGGALLERHGVIRRRTAPSEDVAEVFSRASTALVFDKTGVLRRCASGVVRGGWEDRDGDGEYETPTVPMEPALTNLVQFNVPGASRAAFDMIPLVGFKAALSGEYAVQIKNEDVLAYNLPANYNPNGWSISIWLVPDWSSDDGFAHTILDIRLNANNAVSLRKKTNNDLEIATVAGGTSKTATLTPSVHWTPGTAVFFGLFFNATDATLSFGTTGATSLQTTTITTVGTFAAGTYVIRPGTSGTSEWSPGAYNVLVTNDVSTASIAARFAAGVGQAIATWLESYFASVVAAIQGDASGVLQTDTFQGASQGVLNTGFETNAANWNGSNASVARSTLEFSVGAASLLVTPSTNAGLAYPDQMSIVAGRWFRVVASAKPVTSSMVMQNRGSGVPAFSKTFAPGSWTQNVAVGRLTGGGSQPVVEFNTGGSDTNTFYLDEVYVHQLATLSPATATRSASLPTMNGSGGAFGNTMATIVTPDGTLVPHAFDAGVSAQGQKIVKLDTGASGTKTRRYRLGFASALNGLTANAYSSAVVGLYLKTTSAISVANAAIRFVDSAGAGTAVPMTAKGRWQWIPVQKLIANGATYAYLEIQCEDGTAFATANDALYIALPTIVLGRSLPYPIVNDAEASATKAAETLYFDFPVQQQALTVYLKFEERGSVFGDPRLFSIGDPDGSTSPRLIVYRPTYYQVYFQGQSGGTAATVALAAVPALGDEVEILVTLFDDGSVQIQQSINGAAATSSAVSAAVGIGTAWGSARIYMGGVSGYPAHGSFDDLKVVLGTGYSFDDLRNAA